MNDWTEKQSDNNANPSFDAHFFPVQFTVGWNDVTHEPK